MKKVMFLLMSILIFTGCQLIDEAENIANDYMDQPAEPPAIEEPTTPQVYNVHFQVAQYVWQQDCILYYHGAYVPEGNWEYQVVDNVGTVLWGGSKNGGDENDRYIPVVIKVSQSPVTVTLYSNDAENISGKPVTFTYNANSDSWIIDFGIEEAI